jgi:hypothetical protein
MGAIAGEIAATSTPTITGKTVMTVVTTHIAAVTVGAASAADGRSTMASFGCLYYR